MRRRRKIGNRSVIIKQGGTMISSKWVYISCSLVGVIYASCVVAFSPGIIFHERQHNARLCVLPRVQPKQAISRIGLTSLFMSSDASDSDESDWKALISAFQMYRAAYGDLKVPSRFVVPSMPPWPKSAWGMKLGYRAAAIRSTGTYVGIDPMRKRQLEDIGFLWQVRTASSEKSLNGVTLQQIFDAIEAYKREKDIKDETVTIPNSFVVPNSEPWPINTRGLPLGKQISVMKKKTFQSKNTAAIEKLRELGIKVEAKGSVREARFQKIYLALKTYKQINGDLLVPQPFCVPDSTPEWPEETWGLRLGARVNAIRSQGTFVKHDPSKRKMLEELGFVWAPPPSERGRKRGRKRKEEIEAEEASFAKAGISEAEQESTIAAMDNMFGPSGISEADQESTIAAMDNIFGPSFDFSKDSEPSAMEPVKWDFDGAPILENANVEEGSEGESDVNEPATLNETLTEMTERAMEVGIIELVSEEGNRRRKGQQFNHPPLFNDDFGEEFVFDDVVEALTIYKKMHGDFSNFTMESGHDFVIPESETNIFDEESLESFDTVASARAAAAIAAYEEEGNTSESENLIAAEIKRLRAEVDDDLAMNLEESPSVSQLLATEDEVASKATKISWPQHLSRMPLGYIVKRIKDGCLEVKHLPERKAALDAIGFDWGDEKYFLEIPFEKAFCAFYAYFMIRGDMFVPEDFVMPDEDPWPAALAGYEIGKTVRRLRELQNFIESYHQEKLEILRMIEFVWFPTLALPLDPTKGEKTYEEKICEQYGHPNYFQLPEIPAELMEKIFENGPVNESEDPALWYKTYYDWEYVKDIWYELGCRDRAFALARSEFHQCAKEHAEKYGTGYYDDFVALYDEVNELGEQYLDEEQKEIYGERLLYWQQEINSTIDFGTDTAEIVTIIEDWISDPEDRLDDLDDLDELDDPKKPAEVEAEDVLEDDGDVSSEPVVEAAAEAAEDSAVDDANSGDYEYEYVEVEEEGNLEDGDEYEYEYEYVEEEAGEGDDSDGTDSEEEEEVVDVEDELALGE